MPDYKLLYLPFRGRAESIALMLHHLQVPYTDGRWNPELEWSKVKACKFWPINQPMFSYLLASKG